jgi:anti-anti-sigma factor
MLNGIHQEPSARRSVVEAEPSVDTTVTGRFVIIRITGDITHLTSAGVWQQISALPPAGRFIVLDLQGVTFCDSACLNVLLRARRQARAHQAELVLAAVPQQLLRVLEMTGANQLLPVYSTATDAQADLDGRRETSRSDHASSDRAEHGPLHANKHL